MKRELVAGASGTLGAGSYDPPLAGLRWIDVVWDMPAELNALADQHGLDLAAIEDILDIEQLPKFDDYGDHQFIILHGLTWDAERIDTIEIDCFVKDDLLITVHRSELQAVDWLWEAVQRHPHLTNEGVGELFGHLVEAIGRRYLSVIAEFEKRIDLLADPAIQADVGVLGEIQVLRREESTIRTMLRPQRLVVSELQRHPTFAGEDARRQFADAYDIHNQIVETLVSVRQLLTDTLDTYRGAAAEVQARASTLLTVYAAIVLPMTLIAGWYGMNTANLPAAARPWGWIAVTAVMIIVGVVSWVAFYRAGLVGQGKRSASSRTRGGLAAVAQKPASFKLMERPDR